MHRATSSLAAALAVLCTAAPAAHLQNTVTGAWSGSVIVKHDGKAEEDFVHVVLRQDGETLTGTAGPDADNQYRITKGRVATVNAATTVTFEYIVNGAHSSFSLKLVDGVLKGEARIEGEDGKPHTATVELKRHAGAEAPAYELKGEARIEGEDGKPHTATVELKRLLSR